MKKRKRVSSRTGLLKEYDFSRGVRGKYTRRYAAGTKVVVLEPDVTRSSGIPARSAKLFGH